MFAREARRVPPARIFEKGDCSLHSLRSKVAACVVTTDREQHAVIGVLSSIVRWQGESP